MQRVISGLSQVCTAQIRLIKSTGALMSVRCKIILKGMAGLLQEKPNVKWHFILWRVLLKNLFFLSHPNRRSPAASQKCTGERKTRVQTLQADF